MGYEIAGGLGVKMAALDTGEDRDVIVMVGDGSYLMMAQELVTAVQEGIKLIVVLVQNHGYASIGALSEWLGSQRFGTRYRYRTATGLDGDLLPVDLADNAASLGADVLRATGVTEFEAAFVKAQRSTDGRGARRDRPAGAGPRQPGLVGRPGRRGLGAGEHPDRADAYDENKARQRAHLRPATATPTRHREGRLMRTIEHWIAGKATTGTSTRSGRVCEPRHRRAAGRGTARHRGRCGRGGVRGPGRVRRLVAVVAEQAHEGAVRVPRAGGRQRRPDRRGDHRRARQGARPTRQARCSAGWRSWSSRAASRSCSRATSRPRSRPASTSTRSASRSASAPGSRRSTSRRWCRCGCSPWPSRAGTRSCSSRASATRPRP